MATTDTELVSEARVLTGYTSQVLDDATFESVVAVAKRHIRTRKAIEQETFEWYSQQAREEALFWFTCLFAKVAAGELDSQTLQVGAVDIDTLLAKDDNEVTVWYRNAETALRNINPEMSFIVSAPVREDRQYGSEDSSSSSGLSADDL